MKVFLYRYRKILFTLLLLFFLMGFTESYAQDFCREGKNNQASLSEMVGQMIMVGFRGLEISKDDWIVEAIENLGLGGVVLYDRDVLLKKDKRNIESPNQLRSLIEDLQSRARIPLFVSVDQEGGQVSRLKPIYGFPSTMSAASLGRIGQPELTREKARKLGETLLKVNINMDFAPVIDVNVNPKNPVIGMMDRSFSQEPDKVAAQARSFITGLHEAGILSCIKHFPGHGSAWNDSHFGLTDITETWSEQELRPFSAIIQDGLCDAVMTGHLYNSRLDSWYPATLSAKILKGMLRERLGFDGLIISDDLQMAAINDFYGLQESVYRFIKASGDILLFANNLQYDPKIAVKAHELIVDMVNRGRIEHSRIKKSYHRIMLVKSGIKHAGG